MDPDGVYLSAGAASGSGGYTRKILHVQRRSVMSAEGCHSTGINSDHFYTTGTSLFCEVKFNVTDILTQQVNIRSTRSVHAQAKFIRRNIQTLQ